MGTDIVSRTGEYATEMLDKFKTNLLAILGFLFSVILANINILYTSVFDLVEDLHPLVFAFRFAQPQAAIQRKIKRTPTYLR